VNSEVKKTDGETSLSSGKPIFLQSRTTFIATVFRVMVMFHFMFGHQDISKWIESSAFRSTMVRPADTLVHAQEGYAIQKLSSPSQEYYSFQDAYPEGGSTRHETPPLVFMLLTPILHLVGDNKNTLGRQLWGLVLLVIDLLIGILLEKIALLVLEAETKSDEASLQTKMDKSIVPPKSNLFGIFENCVSSTSSNNDDDSPPNSQIICMADAPLFAAQLYYANPMTFFASGVFDCHQNVWYLCLLWAVHETCRKDGSLPLASLSLAFATYGDVFSVTYLIPMAIWISNRSKRSTSRIFGLLAFFAIWSCCLFGLSNLLLGRSLKTVMKVTYFRSFGWMYETPNLGMQWYLAMQTFDRFRQYAVIMISGLPFLIVTPLTIRLHRYPIVLVASFWSVWTLQRDLPTLNDFALSLSLMVMSTRSLARMGAVSAVALCAITVPVSLYVMDYWLWLETGTGNANFIFFQCLAYNCFATLICLDFVSATLKRDKALRLTRAGLAKVEKK